MYEPKAPVSTYPLQYLSDSVLPSAVKEQSHYWELGTGPQGER